MALPYSTILYHLCLVLYPGHIYTGYKAILNSTILCHDPANVNHWLFSTLCVCVRWQTTLNNAVEECKEKELRCGKTLDRCRLEQVHQPRNFLIVARPSFPCMPT